MTAPPAGTKRPAEDDANGSHEDESKRLKVEGDTVKEQEKVESPLQATPVAVAAALAADIAAVAAPPEDKRTEEERQKAEIQAALEKVKEDNLKKEPSISKLVTQGLWDDNAAKVETALEEIADLSYGNPNAGPNRVTISLTGGLLAIVKALQRFADHPEVQAAGARALQNLALDQNNKSGIASAGGIACVVQAMKAFPENADVQMGGCGTFQNLIWGNDENRKRILEEGGIPIILKAMQLHPNDLDILEWACGSLYLLSVGEAEVKKALLDNKALTILAETLEKHQSDAAILEKGRNAIARMLWP